MGSIIIRNINNRVSNEIVQTYKHLGVSTLGHLTDFGFIKILKPNSSVKKFVGPAVTVKIPHLDSTAVQLVFDYTKPGDVVVVDMSGDTERACWGGMVTYAAVKKGISGAVIDGCTCDSDEIEALGFQVFARGVSSLTTRTLGIEGEIGIPISIDNVVINPGDLVFADRDGIAVLTPEEAAYYMPKLQQMESAEPEEKKKIDSGESLSSIAFPNY